MSRQLVNLTDNVFKLFWGSFFLFSSRNIMTAGQTEDFQAVVVADSDLIGLGGGPLDGIDNSRSCMGQYRVLDGPRHLLDVPD